MYKIIINIIALSTACVLAYFIASSLSNQTVATHASLNSTVGGLFIDPHELALGEVHESAAYSVQFRIRNQTHVTKTVTRFQASCVCASIRPSEMRLKPGEIGILSVMIDLTNRLPIHAGLSRRSLSLRIDPVFAEDFAPSPGWVVTADVLSDITPETDGG